MLLIFGMLIAILIVVINVLRYNRTEYAKATGITWWRVRSNRGAFGEYLTYRRLEEFEKDGAKFLFNCYLPKENGETTEIDVLMLHTSGVYAFESKNFGGWIFGNESQKTWTQSFQNGQKEHFFNPIIQNALHIRWLKQQIGDGVPVYSIVVFSERCTLMRVEVKSPDVVVVKRQDVRNAVKCIENSAGTLISQYDVEQMYSKLYPFTQVTKELKRKHVEDIKSNHGV